MTNKWQCSKCKRLDKINVHIVKVKVKKLDETTIKESISKKDIPKIKCCCRVMRNLTNKAYSKEQEIKKSGIREIKNA